MPDFKIKLKTSSTSGSVPSSSDLVLGELAVNSYDGKLFLKQDNGTVSVIEVGKGTNLSWDASTRTISSDSGNNAVITNATTSDSGLMSGTDKNKLDNIAAGAQVNVATNLSYVANSRELQSSTGTNVTIPKAIASGADGFLSGTDKAKLDGIASGAQVNVSTDLTYTSGTRLLESSTGTNVTLPLVVSSGVAGMMSGTDKAKLDSIDNNAQVNVQSDFNATSGDALILNVPSIPTVTSDLINDSGFIDSNDVAEAATADTIVERTSAADIRCRLVRPNYTDQASINGALAYRVDNGTNNYIRFCNDKGNIRSFLNVLRSDASDTLSGNLTVNRLLLGGSSNGGFDYNPTADTLEILTTNGTTHSEFTASAFVPASNGTKNLGANALRWDTVHANSVKISGNTSWHAGNDGAGSGLDADLLDGQQGSYYLDYNNLTNVPAGGGTNADTVDNLHAASFLRSDADDTATGKIFFNSAIHPSSNAKVQINGFMRSCSIFIHQGGTGTATETSGVELTNTSGNLLWGGSTVWHSGNDGAGTGLDADTLDGVQLNRFVYDKGASLGTSSSWNFINPGIHGVASSSAFTGLGAPSGVYTYGHLVTTEGNTNHGIGQVYYPHTGSSSSKVVFRTGWGGSYEAWSTIWTSNADGAGSGLDADTVDGVQASQFVRNDVVGAEVSSYLTINDHNNFSVLEYEDSSNVSRAHAYTSNAGGYYGIGVFDTAGTNRKDLLLYQNGSILWNSNAVWHAGNDGSGSGLDADTLDGIQGASFLRSDADDTTSGKLYVGGAINSGSVAKFQVNGFIRTTSVFIHQGLGTATETSGMELKNSTGSLVWNGNTLWHSGNDGAGTGLDADLWDGNQFSSYLNQALLTTSNVTHENINSGAWFRNNSSGEGLYNEQNDAHFYSAGDNYWHINANSGNHTAGGLIFYSQYNSTQGNSSNRKGYVYFDTSGFGLLSPDGSWAYRHDNTNADIFCTNLRQNGTNTVWHAGNDGSGSGLDADTLDGVQATSFAQLSSSNSFTNSYNEFGNSTGNVSNNGNWNARVNLGGSQHARLDVVSVSDGIITTLYSHTGQGAGRVGTMSNHPLILMCNASQRAVLSSSGSLSSTVQGTLWGASNDGAGSGLDADTLDGVQGASYLRSDTDDTLTGNFYVDAGTSTTMWVRCDNGGNAIIRAAGESQGTGVVEVGQSTTYGGGFCYNGDGSPSFVSGETADNITFYRMDNGSRTEVFHYPYNSSIVNFNSAPTVSGSTVWHSGNDGAGSGLDADTLDGVQASSFLRSNTNDGFTGRIETLGGSIVAGITTADPGEGNTNIASQFKTGRIHASSGSSVVPMCINRNGTGDLVTLRLSGVEKGSIEVASNRIFFRTQSDYRLKSNIASMSGSAEKVKQLNPCSFTWVDTGVEDEGFVAHEVQQIVAQSVSGTKDEVDDSGEPKYQKLDYAVLIPLLTSALKEAIERIEVLETQASIS